MLLNISQCCWIYLIKLHSILEELRTDVVILFGGEGDEYRDSQE